MIQSFLSSLTTIRWNYSCCNGNYGWGSSIVCCFPVPIPHANYILALEIVASHDWNIVKVEASSKPELDLTGKGLSLTSSESGQSSRSFHLTFLPALLMYRGILYPQVSSGLCNILRLWLLKIGGGISCHFVEGNRQQTL